MCLIQYCFWPDSYRSFYVPDLRHSAYPFPSITEQRHLPHKLLDECTWKKTKGNWLITRYRETLLHITWLKITWPCPIKWLNRVTLFSHMITMPDLGHLLCDLYRESIILVHRPTRTLKCYSAFYSFKMQLTFQTCKCQSHFKPPRYMYCRVLRQLNSP